MLRAFSVRLAHKMRELEHEKRNASALIIQHNFSPLQNKHNCSRKSKKQEINLTVYCVHAVVDASKISVKLC